MPGQRKTPARHARTREKIPADLRKWKRAAKNILEISRDLGIAREGIKALVEEQGYPTLSEGHFAKLLNGQRCPKDQSQFKLAISAVFELHDPRHSRSQHSFLGEIEGLPQSMGGASFQQSTAARDCLVLINTRSEFWENKIVPIIRSCDKLIVLDSFQGSKHKFWNALEEKIARPGHFHLIYLILQKGDPFLSYCLKLIGFSPTVADQDITFTSRLKSRLNESPHKEGKKLEFYYWKGISPGPILSWKVRGTEKIALGFWLNLSDATDSTPYLVVKGGPLFRALRRHLTEIIREAKKLPESKF